MAGVRGVRNPMPKRGGAPTGMFSSKGKQKMDPLGSAYKPSMTAAAFDKPRKGPTAKKGK